MNKLEGKPLVTIDYVLITDLICYGDTISLHNLSPFRNYIISSIGDLKRKTICVLDQIFPKYHSAFSNVFGKTPKELLLLLNSHNDFEDISSEQLEKLLFEFICKNFAKKKLDTISSLSKTSFGITFCVYSFSFKLKLLIEQINLSKRLILSTPYVTRLVKTSLIG